MEKQEFTKRSRHNKEIMADELLTAVDTIQSVANQKNLTFDQVLGVYRAQAVNRLAEVIIDAGDQHDANLEDTKDFIARQLSHHREWCYDNQPLRVEIQK